MSTLGPVKYSIRQVGGNLSFQTSRNKKIVNITENRTKIDTSLMLLTKVNKNKNKKNSKLL